MSNWVAAARADEVTAGTGRELVLADRIVALYRVADDFFALDGICPHQGGPLGKGALRGCIVTCPWHGWQFDVRNGQHQVNANLRHPQFPVKVEDGVVFVDMNG